MTRVELYIMTRINGVGWMTYNHSYIYEKFCTTDYLKLQLERLRKSKYNWVGMDYNKIRDEYRLFFSLEMII